MRLAILTDPHIGYTGESDWHNRKLWTEAPDVLRAAVTQVNGLGVDRVMVLGDLTESGETEELESAHDILDGLNSQWWVLPGNHDRQGLASGAFDRIFARHLPPVYEAVDGIGLLSLREEWPREERNSACLDWGALEPHLEALLAAPPTLLAVFAHFSLVPERDHAEQHAGKYAGHWANGDRLLGRLLPALSGRIAVFCGHQHWHHLLPSADLLHCTTASLIEYPMEGRLLTLLPSHLAVETLDTASPDIAAASLNGVTWVRGEARDRAYQTAIPFPVTG